MAGERACEIRQGRCRLLEDTLDRRRVLRAERPPGPPRQVELLRRHPRTVRFELFQLRCREWRDVSVNYDHGNLFLRRFSAAEEIQQLDQLQLVIEIVLEPENYLVEVVQMSNHPVPLGEITTDVGEVVPVVAGDEASALFAQLLQRKGCIDGSFVEHVANVVALCDPAEVIEDREPVAARIVGGECIPLERGTRAVVILELRLGVLDIGVAADAE